MPKVGKDTYASLPTAKLYKIFINKAISPLLSHYFASIFYHDAPIGAAYTLSVYII